MLLLTFFLSTNKNIALVPIVINFAFLFSFYSVLSTSFYYKNGAYNIKNLIFIVTLYSFIFVIILNSYYYFETGTFFEFSARDSLHYDKEAKLFIKTVFYTSIENFLRYNELAELGAVLTTSVAYLFFPSPISYHIFNILAGIVTVVSIFKISRQYMSNQYAYFCSLAYSLSSFTIYLYSTGMKESFFVMFIVLFYEKASAFFTRKTLINLIIAIAALVILLLFRPAVFSMILFSVPLGFILTKKQDVYSILLIIIFILIVFVYYFDFFQGLIFKLLIFTNRNVVGQKQNLDPSTFNYVMSFFSSLLGPFPSYLSIIDREQQAFYSVGLGFRVFISLFSLRGIYLSFKNKAPLLLSMGIFVLAEMLVLASILESFELRLNSPHLVPVYILAFYGMYWTKKNKANMRFLKTSLYVLGGVLLIWNLRY